VTGPGAPPPRAGFPLPATRPILSGTGEEKGTRLPDRPVSKTEDRANAAGRARVPGISPKRSLGKAVSWRIVGSLDTLVLSFLILTFLGPLFGMEERSATDNARTAGYIAVTEVVTKMALYYAHEQIWGRAIWGVSSTRDGKRVETRSRSGLKTATWRVTASLDTMLLGLIFTGNLATALSIGVFEVATKLVLYYLHERAWDRTGWGTHTD